MVELRKYVLNILAAVALMSGPALAAPVPQQAADPVASEIQHVLTAAPERVGGEKVDAATLRTFYESRQWRPAWLETANGIEDTLDTAKLDGLPSQPLHLKTIHALLTSGKSPARKAEADLLLTDALLAYTSAMRGQRVDPTGIETDWFLRTPPFDSLAFLRQNGKGIVAALKTLSPPYAGYQALRNELASLRGIAHEGDWPKVAKGPTIRPGDVDDRVLDVRKRLIATGELASSEAEGTTYDDTLKEAVSLFQRRHGLDDDGQIGPQTVRTMNVSASERAREVALNMERWRWLPAHLGDPRIVVNVPAASLELVNDGKAVLSMRTVVGDPEHPTPALRARLTSLVLNPVWRVPASIATAEILPKLKKNPGYLIANDLELVSDSFSPGSAESQGVGIDWKSFSAMPWPVRQKSGSDNALGRIKFNIPNGDDIYLHDTPNHKAFSRSYRALSHGCVRLEKPDELALYLLQDKDWAADRLANEIQQGDTKTLQVTKPMTVWLLYWTAWVDPDGILQTRNDLYGRDRRLAAALANPPPHPAVQAAQTAPLAPQTVCEGCRIP